MNKTLRHGDLLKRYSELLEIFSNENSKLDRLLPPPDLSHDDLTKWYMNSENKAKLHHQFEVLKASRKELSKAWKEYFESLRK